MSDSLPQVHNGDALQPYKAQLNRRLHTIRARGERETDKAELMVLLDAATDTCQTCQGAMVVLVSLEQHPTLTMRIVCHRCAAARAP